MFQQKLAKRVVFSVLTQFNKLKDSTDVFLSLKFVPGCPSSLVPSANSQRRDVRVYCFSIFRGLWFPFVLALNSCHTPGNTPAR